MIQRLKTRLTSIRSPSYCPQDNGFGVAVGWSFLLKCPTSHPPLIESIASPPDERPVCLAQTGRFSFTCSKRPPPRERVTDGGLALESGGTPQGRLIQERSRLRGVNPLKSPFARSLEKVVRERGRSARRCRGPRAWCAERSLAGWYRGTRGCPFRRGISE